MTENIISYRGIPFVGKHPVGELRWKVPVDVIPDDGVSLEPFEAYANGAAKDIDFIQVCNKNEMNFFVYSFDFDDRKAKMFPKLTDAEKKLVESFWNDMTGVESWERDSRLLSQIWFNAPIIKLAESLTKGGGKSYAYYFTPEADLPIMKCGYAIELAVVFNHPDMTADTGRVFNETFSQASYGIRRVRYSFRKGIRKKNRRLGQNLFPYHKYFDKLPTVAEDSAIINQSLKI